MKNTLLFSWFSLLLLLKYNDIDFFVRHYLHVLFSSYFSSHLKILIENVHLFGIEQLWYKLVSFLQFFFSAVFCF